MPEIEFRGEWHPDDAHRIALELQKSLGMGDGEGIPADLNPPQITGDLQPLLSARQKKLVEMLKRAGKKAVLECEPGEECDTATDWDGYSLKKSLSTGQMRVTPKGRFRLNSNRRWERVDDDSPTTGTGTLAPSGGGGSMGQFDFDKTDGEFGRGIYFPVLSEPTGGLRIRLRLLVRPGDLVSDEEFYNLENDLSLDTDLILDSKGVKAIARTEGDRVTLLMVRDGRDIEPMGIVANSGAVPTGTPTFQLVKLEQRDDGCIVDVEMVDLAATLAKSAKVARRGTLESKSYLEGTPLIRTSAPPLDRQLVRKAVDRCKLDGVPMDAVQVCMVQGVPDFLPRMTHAFCLPSDLRVCLCPHDPQGAISYLCDELATRLQTAVRAGAIAGDTALEILACAARLSPDWWLEMVIKRYVGAALCERRWGILNGGEPPRDYMALLVARGAGYWGNRKQIAECMAEDFRCAYDPAGLPNLVCLEYDAALPGVARAAQQLLLKGLTQ